MPVVNEETSAMVVTADVGFIGIIPSIAVDWCIGYSSVDTSCLGGICLTALANVYFGEGYCSCHCTFGLDALTKMADGTSLACVKTGLLAGSLVTGVLVAESDSYPDTIV